MWEESSSVSSDPTIVRTPSGWEEIGWEDALHFVADHFINQEIGVLASPQATLEELFLAGKLAGGAGAADFRLRHSDFSGDGKRAGIPWLGMSIPELEQLDRVLVIGSFLRKESPLIAARLRQAVKHGAQVHLLHSVDDDWLMPLASRKVVRPSEIVGAIAGTLVAMALSELLHDRHVWALFAFVAALALRRRQWHSSEPS